jgi:hypothetical protein
MIHFTETSDDSYDMRTTQEEQSHSWAVLRRLFVVVAVLVVACGILVIWVVYDENRSVAIHYIIPNNYRGPLKIVGDGQDNGGYSFEAGRHVYHFPRSGVPHVKTTWPFNYWHRVTAEYENGATIYWVGRGTPDSEAIRLSELGGSGEGNGLTAYWDVVGNEAQVKHWQDEWEGAGSQGLGGPSAVKAELEEKKWAELFPAPQQ